MFYLVLILGLVSMAAGVFVIGFGVPIRETVFGSGLLASGTVAVTAGFILIGLAATVRELRRVGQALKARAPMVARPLRPVERKDSTDKRPGPPRMAAPRPGPEGRAPVADAAEAEAAMRTTGSAPEPLPQERKSGPEWIKRAIAEIEASPAAPELAPIAHDEFRGIESAVPPQGARAAQDAWLRPAAPQPSSTAVPPAPQGAAPHNIFDLAWPPDRRRTVNESAPPSERRYEPPGEPLPRPLESRSAELRPADVRPAPAPPTPPLSVAPATAPGRSEQRPLTILKSGVIDEMAYTLFSDGSIEAQMPDGTMRFSSIEALREHLETQTG